MLSFGHHGEFAGAAGRDVPEAHPRPDRPPAPVRARAAGGGGGGGSSGGGRRKRGFSASPRPGGEVRPRAAPPRDAVTSLATGAYTPGVETCSACVRTARG